VADASREYAVVGRCAGDRVVAIMHPAHGSSHQLGVVIVVGGPQYRVGSHRQFVNTARSLAAAGYATLRFDYRGMGDSDGPLRTFESVQDDIRWAIDMLLAQAPQLSGVVLWGLCDAASAVLMYCLHDQRLRGLIIANPWVRTEQGQAAVHLWHYYPRRVLQLSFWRKMLGGGVRIGNTAREFAGVTKRALSGPEAAAAKTTGFIDAMAQGFTRFRGRILLFISERDLTASEFTSLCSSSRRWRAARNREDVELRRLAGADHTFSNRRHLDEANAACIEWLGRLAG
jgi:uncharacterized protein